MTRLLRTFFISGLGVVLPTAFTVYLLWWIGSQAEALLGGAFRTWLPEGWYVPGMGVAAGLLLILVIGILTRIWLARELIALGERILAHIPLVKTIYTPLKDMMRMFTRDQQQQLSRVVRTRVGEGWVIGFVTRSEVRLVAEDDALLAVYFPMSYQIGGYTLLLPESRLEQLDMSVEEGMRFVLTAGLAQGSSVRTKG